MQDGRHYYTHRLVTSERVAFPTRSKSKRSDYSLLTMGVVLDGSGFLRRSQVFPGYVGESKTLQAMLARLDAPPGALVVMNRGIATQGQSRWERIGRLKEKSHGVGQYYDITLVPDEKNINALALRWKQRSHPKGRLANPHVYCLRTNETRWDAERLWHTYVMLTDLEAVFRSFKSELGLRPISHQKPERSAGHLFITVLAYQFVQIIRRHLRAQKLTASRRSLRETLAGQCRITATFRREDGRTLHVRKATQAEPA